MNETYKQMSEIAKKNGFYLTPEKVWNEIINRIEYLESEVKRLTKSRDDWKNKLKKSKK